MPVEGDQPGVVAAAHAEDRVEHLTADLVLVDRRCVRQLESCRAVIADRKLQLDLIHATAQRQREPVWCFATHDLARAHSRLLEASANAQVARHRDISTA